jgi:hypothetical protein
VLVRERFCYERTIESNFWLACIQLCSARRCSYPMEAAAWMGRVALWGPAAAAAASANRSITICVLFSRACAAAFDIIYTIGVRN